MAQTEKQKRKLRIFSMFSIIKVFPALLNSIIKYALFFKSSMEESSKSKEAALSFPVGGPLILFTSF